MFLDEEEDTRAGRRQRTMSSLAVASLLLISLASITANGQQVDQQVDSEAEQRGPEQIFVRPNEHVRIACRLPSMAESKTRYYHWNFQQTAGGSSKPHVLCYDNKCALENEFGFRLRQDKSTGDYDLEFERATYELNDGLYYCDYKDSSLESKMQINREYRLTVLIPPGPPTLQPLGQQAAAREGQEHQLVCQTQGGNPEPNITWFRNEQPLVATTTTTSSSQWLRIEQTTRLANTTSTLTWVPSLDDHQAVYKCVVRNSAMAPHQVHERELRLQVEYAPRIQVGAHQPLRVLEGRPATLPCQVEANPPVKQVRWFRDGQPVSGAYNFTISAAKLSDAALYTCQADNGIAPLQSASSSPASGGLFAQLLGVGQQQHHAAEAQLQLQVLYGPRVQVVPMGGSNKQLNEGDQWALNCSVQSWPPAHEFVWTKWEDPSYRRVTPSSLLEFPSLSAADSGNYTCTAHVRLEPSFGQPQERHASDWALVQVRHKPGQAEILLGANGEAELGAPMQLQCRSKPPGYPEPSYKFWRSNRDGKRELLPAAGRGQQLGATYSILGARADDEGRYGCSASNLEGQSTEAEGELVVNEVPHFMEDQSAHWRDSDIRQPGETPFSITIRGEGKPEPKVTWFHRSPVDGRRYELSSMPAKFRIETVSKPAEVHQRGLTKSTAAKFHLTSTLNFRQPLEVADRGQYSVELSNGLSQVARQHFQLHVHHAPIAVPKNQPLIPLASSSSAATTGTVAAPSTWRAKAGYEPGEQVNLTCRVSASPRPDVSWHGPGDTERPIDANSRYKISTWNPRDDIWESTLSFVLMQESDYDDYMCAYSNWDPQTQRASASVRTIITLQHKSIPDAPSQLQAVDVGQDYVSLQWLSGYDGGFPQNQFIVQWAPDDGSNSPLARRFANADSQPLRAAASLASGASASAQDHLLQLGGQQQQPGDDFPRLQECHQGATCVVGGLQPRQAYVFRIRARNELGLSDYSDELRASTRANSSQLPRILEPFFDSAQNALHFRVEPGSDYLLNNLLARIEIRTPRPVIPQQPPQDLQLAASGAPAETQQGEQELPPVSTLVNVPIQQERVEALLNVQPASEEIRISLCLRSNEQLCGPEASVNLKAASSSFFGPHQRGLSLYMLASTLSLIVLLGAFATSLHSCCLARRKHKKAAALETGDLDNKHHLEADKAGSTTSTNSTVANSNGAGGGGLPSSMDSISGGAINNGLANGTGSDHSSDHSRQAKLDSMLPPNYNHYADRATLMMEQQQQQQQQQQQLMQQQGLQQMDKLGSPFGLPNGALMSPQQQQLFGYGGQQQMMEPAGLMLSAESASEQQMWADDYNNYNALASYQQQQQEQMIDPTYGTTGGVLMAPPPPPPPQDNNYLNSYQQQQQQYQQLAAAQQQMYGTLTRNGYASTTATAQDMSASPSVIQQQQQHQQLLEQQYSAASNGLMASSQGQQQQQPPQPPQESDYGTTGGSRSGRVIREIIV